MEIILREDVDKLGSSGDIVEVADGYGRNYLIPRGYAVQATESQKKRLRNEIEKAKKRKAEKTEQAQELKTKLEAERFIFPVKAGENGKLFGSVTSKDISEAAASEGYELDKRNISLDENIKELGVHKVPVKLFDDIYANLIVEVIEAKEEEDKE
ncbi:MAG: 50S ribosomal protein L9 [Halanaerobiales bacterium]|nr:50S ribosomal protein L9 [Halanaerobiales bacterium]